MNTHTTVLGSALDEATRDLAATSPTPRLDAQVLLMYVCGLARTGLLTRANDVLDTERYGNYRRLVERRREGEPIAYIVGVREFWSLSLTVTPAVLIPRPETELLVERALIRIPRDGECTVADLGTGSGAIALAIAHERPHASIAATDASPDALEIAQDNARRLGYVNIRFHLRDWLTVSEQEQFDVIVSNPPYLRADDPHLEQGDVRYEPRSALVAGPDGLAAIRRLADDARERLRPGGWLLLEHGHDQADAVAAILRNAGFPEFTCHRDLAGQPRVTETRQSVVT